MKWPPNSTSSSGSHDTIWFRSIRFELSFACMHSSDLFGYASGVLKHEHNSSQGIPRLWEATGKLIRTGDALSSVAVRPVYTVRWNPLDRIPAWVRIYTRIFCSLPYRMIKANQPRIVFSACILKDTTVISDSKGCETVRQSREPTSWDGWLGKFVS